MSPTPPTPEEYPTPWTMRRPTHAPRLWVVSAANTRYVFELAERYEPVLRIILDSVNAAASHQKLREACEAVINAVDKGSPLRLIESISKAAEQCRAALAADAGKEVRDAE